MEDYCCCAKWIINWARQSERLLGPKLRRNSGKIELLASAILPPQVSALCLHRENMNGAEEFAVLFEPISARRYRSNLGDRLDIGPV